MRILISLMCLLALSTFAKPLPLNNLQLRPGFRIDVYAEVPEARQLALGTNNIVYVGTKTDKVYAILPEKNSAGLHRTLVLASGLNHPNGVAVNNGDLYVGEIHRIIKFSNIASQLNNPHYTFVTDVPVKKTGSGRYETHHAWKTIGFSPDKKLYIAVGVPCNICIPEKNFGTIINMNADGSDKQIYATGVRNSVGFDWDPLTKRFWFTDNGRDWLGDNSPPDKLNYAPHAGLFFGFPYFHGLDAEKKPIVDPKYGANHSSANVTWPAYQLPAHVAALGMSFYTGKMFPAQYQNQIIIAEHGSWNRTQKIGYRLSLVKLNADRKPILYEPFVAGWEQNQRTWGRPVSTLVMPDGSLLVSDDYAGVIYRITYS